MTADYDLVDLLTLAITDGADGLTLRVGEKPVIHWHGEPHSIPPAIAICDILR